LIQNISTNTISKENPSTKTLDSIADQIQLTLDPLSSEYHKQEKNKQIFQKHLANSPSLDLDYGFLSIYPKKLSSGASIKKQLPICHIIQLQITLPKRFTRCCQIAASNGKEFLFSY
jgi:hypothetical protein